MRKKTSRGKRLWTHHDVVFEEVFCSAASPPAQCPAIARFCCQMIMPYPDLPGTARCDTHAYCSGLILPPLRHLASLNSLASLGFSPFLQRPIAVRSSADRKGSWERRVVQTVLCCLLSLLFHDYWLLLAEQGCGPAVHQPSAAVSRPELVESTQPI